MVRRILEESAAEGLPGGGGLAELHMGGMCRPIALRLPGAPFPAHSLGPLFPLIGTPFPAPWYPPFVITSDGPSDRTTTDSRRRMASRHSRCWTSTRTAFVATPWVACMISSRTRCTVPRHATPRHATPRHATPRHATPRHATPRHALRPRLCMRRITPLFQRSFCVSVRLFAGTNAAWETRGRHGIPMPPGASVTAGMQA
jgi:hypothetical protein